MLEMPQLGRVPRTLTLHRQSKHAARAALALLDAGELRGPHLPQPAPQLVSIGLQQWIDRMTEGLPLFRFTVRYHEFAENTKPLRIEIAIPYAGLYTIGAGVKKAEAAITGLGETTLYWIGQVSHDRCPIVTPALALEMAQWHYWRGENDEREVIEEAALNGEDPKDLDIFTRAKFDKAIPGWASAPKRRIDYAGLERLANPRRTMHTGKVARALIALIDALAKRRRLAFGLELRESISDPILLLQWQDDRIMTMIVDDLYQEIYESGEDRDELAAQEFDPSEPDFAEQLRGFLAGLAPLFPILRALVALVRALVNPQTLAHRHALGDF